MNEFERVLAEKEFDKYFKVDCVNCKEVPGMDYSLIIDEESVGLFEEEEYTQLPEEVYECENPNCENAIEGPFGTICGVYNNSQLLETLKEKGYR